MIPPELWIFVRDFVIFLSIYLIVSLSLNLEAGYGGIPNFGKVLAVAGGAFSVSFFPGRIMASVFGMDPSLDYVKDNVAMVTEINQILLGNPGVGWVLFIVTLAIAAVVGAILGFIASYPGIRLREDYLAITLLAMGEAIQVIAYNYTPIAGGTLGVIVPDPFVWAVELRYTVVAVVALAICVLVFFYLERLVRTPLGRMLRAVRDNEDVAESLGKNVTRIRMKAIILASMLGAVAGALDAFKSAGVISMTYHRLSWTFWPWVMVILGGAANNTGIVVGSFAFASLRRLIDYFKEGLAPFVPFSVVWLDYLLLGALLIVIQFYRPEGIIPEKPTPTLGNKRIRKIAESREGSSSKERGRED